MLLERLARLRAARGLTLPRETIVRAFTEALGPVKLMRPEDEQAAFEANIDQDPTDHANHLVYADWLDDNGHSEEAAFRRSMGNWIRDGREDRHPLYWPAANRRFPWIVTRNFPEGANNIADVPHWTPSDEVEPGLPGFEHVTPQSIEQRMRFPFAPVDHSKTYRAEGGAYRAWRSYRGMERAFREAFKRNTPTRLARSTPVLTFVGGAAIPGAVRAVGVFPDGAEESNAIVSDDPEGLARANGQHTAIWFTPGSGPDLLHIFPTPPSPRAFLSSHGVPYATVTADRTYVIDQGGQFSGLGGRSVLGTATFREIESPVRLAKRKPPTHVTVPYTDPELQAMFASTRPEGNFGPTDHRAAGALSDWLQERGDWRWRLVRDSARFIGSLYTRSDGELALVEGERIAGVQHGKDKNGGSSHIYRAVSSTGKPFVGVHNRHPTPGLVTSLYSLMTPEEYKQMQAEAETAGVKFPDVN